MFICKLLSATDLFLLFLSVYYLNFFASISQHSQKITDVYILR